MRENGFDYPLHPLQCLTWALFPVVLLDFYWPVSYTHLTLPTICSV